jgi:hypothetical protein
MDDGRPTVRRPRRVNQSRTTAPVDVLNRLTHQSGTMTDGEVAEGPAAFAVGRAAMSGPAMTESTRGIAVEVRHSEEK